MGETPNTRHSPLNQWFWKFIFLETTDLRSYKQLQAKLTVLPRICDIFKVLASVLHVNLYLEI